MQSHFGVGAPPILVHFSGDWDVHKKGYPQKEGNPRFIPNTPRFTPVVPYISVTRRSFRSTALFGKELLSQLSALQKECPDAEAGDGGPKYGPLVGSLSKADGAERVIDRQIDRSIDR